MTILMSNVSDTEIFSSGAVGRPNWWVRLPPRHYMLYNTRIDVIETFGRLVERVRTILSAEQHILITGPAASGKSRVAAKLANALGVPVVHLDNFGYKNREGSRVEWLIDFSKVPTARIYEGTADNLLSWALLRVRTIIFPIATYPLFQEAIRRKIEDGKGHADPFFITYWQKKSKMTEREYYAYAISKTIDWIGHHRWGHYIIYVHDKEEPVSSGWYEAPSGGR
jgi:hypothetical protein